VFLSSVGGNFAGDFNLLISQDNSARVLGGVNLFINIVVLEKTEQTVSGERKNESSMTKTISDIWVFP
jgi:hypothetical protein